VIIERGVEAGMILFIPIASISMKGERDFNGSADEELDKDG
jgi:hypothetical protein